MEARQQDTSLDRLVDAQPPAPGETRRAEARLVVEDAAGSLRRWQVGAAGAGIAAIALLAIAFGPLRDVLLTNIYWIFQGIFAGGAGLLAGAQVRRVRRRLRRFSDPEAIALLKPLEEDPRPEVQRIVKPLLSGMNPEGTEAAPADAPAGSGKEVARVEDDPRSSA